MNRHELRPYQLDAIRYAEGRESIALFMEMRLGKSVVVIKWAQSHNLKRVLLVAPLTTLRGSHQWEGELVREGITNVVALPKFKKQEWSKHFWRWQQTDRGLQRRRASGWFLIHYQALQHRPDILDQQWDAIILDESTKIRNPKAGITKLLLRRTGHIQHKALLSGLPNPESPWDYFCQFQFLHGHFMDMDNYWAWKQKHFHRGFSQWSWVPNPGTRDKIKEYVHAHAFVLQRKTAGVGSNKIRKQIRVPMTRTQKDAMKVMRREYALAGYETKWITVVHMWMQRLAGGWHPTLEPPELMSDAKLVALAKIARTTKPLVVWFRFNHEIESAYHYLRKHVPGIRAAYVHGAMKNSKALRVQHQEAFQAGRLDAILIQVKLGKYGWNLSRSSTAVYYSNSYEFEDRSQSEDRIIHLTKTDPCNYIDLVTIGTPDEDVVTALVDKRITARQFGTRIKHSILKHLCPSNRTKSTGTSSIGKVGSSSVVRPSRYASSGTGRLRAETRQLRLFSR